MQDQNHEKNKRIFVSSLSTEQRLLLENILKDRGWEFKSIPYAFWQAKDTSTVIVAYESGKLTVQGKGTEDFVLYTLEPQILNTYSYGYEKSEAASSSAVQEDPLASFTPHAGLDESGKGDFFGPLVISSVFVSSTDEARALLKAGVRDSKTIKSDAAILKTASQIRQIVQGRFSVVVIGPEAYNRMYEKIGNLNRLLAWGHARALENILDKSPECPEVIADKFGDERLILNALMEKGRNIKVTQRTKAEADVAVAAASILARAGFIKKLEEMGAPFSVTLPRGASAAVEATAVGIIEAGGSDRLHTIAKMHFKTAYKVLGLPMPEKPAYQKYR